MENINKFVMAAIQESGANASEVSKFISVIPKLLETNKTLTKGLLEDLENLKTEVSKTSFTQTK